MFKSLPLNKLVTVYEWTVIGKCYPFFLSLCLPGCTVCFLCFKHQFVLEIMNDL